MTADN